MSVKKRLRNNDDAAEPQAINTNKRSFVCMILTHVMINHVAEAARKELAGQHSKIPVP